MNKKPIDIAYNVVSNYWVLQPTPENLCGLYGEIRDTLLEYPFLIEDHNSRKDTIWSLTSTRFSSFEIMRQDGSFLLIGEYSHSIKFPDVKSITSPFSNGVFERACIHFEIKEYNLTAVGYSCGLAEWLHSPISVRSKLLNFFGKYRHLAI